jgi:energy-coupling factor transport system substrate-specific component
MRNASTRLLLTCAAIGVAGGLVFVISGYLNGIVSATVPLLYGSLVGVYFLPGVVTQSLLRRGGVALLTGVFAGLIAAAFSPQWFLRYFGAGLAIGLLQEVPFLFSRYRYWRAWVFYLAAGGAGLVLGAGVFIGIGAEKFEPWANVAYFGLFVISPILFTWLGRIIANRIDKTGVARGLQREIDRRAAHPTTGAPVTTS